MMRWAAAACVIAACGAPAAPQAPEPAPVEPSAVSAQPPGTGERELIGGIPDTSPGNAKLAAIQKAMNELDEASQQCWAAAATERFAIAGELTLQIEIAPATAQAVVVRDTAHNARLAACLVTLLGAYRWAPPLHGETIQLPFKFRAPDGQSTIDRALVAWSGQGSGAGRVALAVLLDEANTGNSALSMVELALASNGSTGLRRADRAELWYFAGAADVRWTTGRRSVAAGDMMYAPPGAAREVIATSGDLHAVIAIVPGGREGAARSGALPTRELSAGASAAAPMILPAAGAKTYGRATIFGDAAILRGAPLAASILTMPAGTQVPEHIHAQETEALYILAGSGTLTVNGVALPVTPTTVLQIPKGVRHAFTATADVRAVQLYTPAGPEQRFKRQ